MRETATYLYDLFVKHIESLNPDWEVGLVSIELDSKLAILVVSPCVHLSG